MTPCRYVLRADVCAQGCKFISAVVRNARTYKSGSIGGRALTTWRTVPQWSSQHTWHSMACQMFREACIKGQLRQKKGGKKTAAAAQTMPRQALIVHLSWRALHMPEPEVGANTYWKTKTRENVQAYDTQQHNFWAVPCLLAIPPHVASSALVEMEGERKLRKGAITTSNSACHGCRSWF